MVKMAFLAVNNFFWCFFKNTEQNNNCVFIVFKVKSDPKDEEKFFCVFFFKIQKRAFSKVKNQIVLKIKFQICISAFVFYCKRKLHTNFHKKNIDI